MTRGTTDTEDATGRSATGLRLHLGVGALMLAASAAMMSPFMSASHFGAALHHGDGRVQAWVLAWVAHALGSGRPLLDANMFHPAPAALTHTDHMVALGAVSAPLWWVAGNAILTFNVMQLAGPALAAYAMFVLARAWTGDTPAAIVAGLAYGFSSFTLLHNAHLNLTWNFGIPLSLLAFERWWTQPTWPGAARWWLPAVFTAMVSWYLALLLALLLAAACAWLALTRDRGDTGTRIVQLAASALLAIAVLLPLLAPYLGRTAAPGEAAAYAADWRSYLVPSEHTVVGRWLYGQGLTSAQTIFGERTLFLGWTALALAGVGALRARALQRRRAIFLSIAGACAVALSFGPAASGYAPFDLLAVLPGASGFRATARFALLAVFAVALLAAFGLSFLRRRFRRAAAAMPVLCALVVLGEVFVVDFPVGTPAPEAMPAVYRLARADGARAAVSLPMYVGRSDWFLEGDYLLYSTTAGFLPLANGIGRWVPDEYLAIGEAMTTFPSAEAAAALRLYGITHVIVHGRRFADGAAGLLGRARQSADFSVVGARGSDTLLRVNPTER